LETRETLGSNFIDGLNAGGCQLRSNLNIFTFVQFLIAAGHGGTEAGVLFNPTAKPLDSQVDHHVLHAPGRLPKFPKLVPAEPTSQEQRQVAPPVTTTIPKFLPTLPFDYSGPASNRNVKRFRFDPNASFCGIVPKSVTHHPGSFVTYLSGSYHCHYRAQLPAQ
jgi:hypothetical protein